MAVIFVADGTLAVGQSVHWYVWWPGPQVYLGPVVFQASPLDPDGEIELSDHTRLRTSANPPQGVAANAQVHSFTVRNRGTAATGFYIWCLRE
jgi:hypothetical protein